MKPETLEALKASISKWDRNAKADDPDHVTIGGDNCPLCNLSWETGGCTRCPVREATGQNCCEGTPYYGASVALGTWRSTGRIEEKGIFHTAALAERDFLIGLLPAGETWEETPKAG